MRSAVVASIAYIYQAIYIDRRVGPVHRQIDRSIELMDAKMIVDVTAEASCRGERPASLVDWCDCSAVNEQVSKIYAVERLLAKSPCTYEQVMSGCAAYRNEQLEKLCITRIDASYSSSKTPPCGLAARDCSFVCIPNEQGGKCPISGISLDKGAVTVSRPQSAADGIIVNLYLDGPSSHRGSEVVQQGDPVQLMADRLRQTDPTAVRVVHDHLKKIVYPHIAMTVAICICSWIVYPSAVIYVIYSKSDVQLSHLSAIIVMHLFLLTYSFHLAYHVSYLPPSAIYGRSIIYSLVHLAACVAQLVSLVCLHRLSTLVMHIRSIMATI